MGAWAEAQGAAWPRGREDWRGSERRAGSRRTDSFDLEVLEQRRAASARGQVGGDARELESRAATRPRRGGEGGGGARPAARRRLDEQRLALLAGRRAHAQPAELRPAARGVRPQERDEERGQVRGGERVGRGRGEPRGGREAECAAQRGRGGPARWQGRPG